jgi:hypothetical protein
MGTGLAGTITLVASTGLFIILLGGLALMSIRAARRSKKMERELDNDLPKIAAMVQRRLVKRDGKPNTRLDLIINESFSAGHRQQ